MTINLDHTIIPAKDKELSARFFAMIFGLEFKGLNGHFAPVQLNDGLTLDFDNRDKFESHHYAFRVTEQTFDEIFGRIKEEGVIYGSDPGNQTNMTINRRNGGRGLYFRDPNGHSLELLAK